MDLNDTLAAIDDLAVHRCGQCDIELGPDAPSTLFCSPEHQEEFYAARSEALVGYREPVELAAHVDNQREEGSPETTPESPLLQALWQGLDRAMRLELHTSTPPVSPADDDGSGYAHGGWGQHDIQWSGPEVSWAIHDEAERLREQDIIARAMAEPDVRERAPEARRNRNTGPQYRHRAPRRNAEVADWEIVWPREDR